MAEEVRSAGGVGRAGGVRSGGGVGREGGLHRTEGVHSAGGVESGRKTGWEVGVLNEWEAEEIGGNYAPKINVLQSTMT